MCGWNFKSVRLTLWRSAVGFLKECGWIFEGVRLKQLKVCCLVCTVMLLKCVRLRLLLRFMCCWVCTVVFAVKVCVLVSVCGYICWLKFKCCWVCGHNLLLSVRLGFAVKSKLVCVVILCNCVCGNNHLSLSKWNLRAWLLIKNWMRLWEPLLEFPDCCQQKDFLNGNIELKSISKWKISKFGEVF